MWSQRAARARFLAGQYPASREILLFSAELATWQAEVAGREPSSEELLERLRALVSRAGPPTLQAAAEGLTQLPDLQAPPPLSFFARAARQPFAAREAAAAPDIQGDTPMLRCPDCDQPPQVGCLRTEGDGLALELVCSLCFRRWPFPRSGCPACGGSGAGRLVYYTAPQFPHLRLQACEDCRTYLHLIDLSKDPAAIPEVDELAALPLDLWAVEQGYRKLCPNLAGV